MVELVSKLKQWTTEFLEGSGEFPVEVEHKPGSGKFVVFIDGDTPVSIGRCAQVSRHLSDCIDKDTGIADEERFTIEVSSPGADRPLRLLRQFKKHTGRQLETVLSDGRILKGTLAGIDGEMIHLILPVSKKESKEEAVNFKDIKESKVIISFK